MPTCDFISNKKQQDFISSSPIGRFIYVGGSYQHVGIPYHQAKNQMIEELKKMIVRKHVDDMLFIEKQMQMMEALTCKRMEMVRVIREQNPSSIRELANFLERDVKNVFDDVQLLNRMHIIRLVRIGQSVKPIVKKKVIVISLE